MILDQLFAPMPSTTAALLLFYPFSHLAAASALPRETRIVEQQPLNVVPWPIVATPLPVSPNDLFRRQAATVCGYIGGDPNIPATCSAGSHCAADVKHGAIGCCPDDSPCTTGIFTGCVDGNSGPQTIANPYVYTCTARNVCYKNVFEGGFYQYGCGSATNLATTVLATASGKGRLQLHSVTAALTASPTLLSQPVTLTSESPKTSATATTGSATSTDADASQSTSADGGAAPGSGGSNNKNTGAIVGGTLGGIAAIFALAGLGVFFWRRRSKHHAGRAREDGSDPNNMRSMEISNPQIQPLSTRQDKPGFAAPVPSAANHESDRASLESGVFGHAAQHNIGTAVTRNAGASAESDRIPLTGELRDFSHGFNSALDSIETDSDAENNTTPAYPGPRRGAGGGGGALWQQNRRRSRNLAWM